MCAVVRTQRARPCGWSLQEYHGTAPVTTGREPFRNDALPMRSVAKGGGNPVVTGRYIGLERRRLLGC